MKLKGKRFSDFYGFLMWKYFSRTKNDWVRDKIFLVINSRGNRLDLWPLIIRKFKDPRRLFSILIQHPGDQCLVYNSVRTITMVKSVHNNGERDIIIKLSL